MSRFAIVSTLAVGAAAVAMVAAATPAAAAPGHEPVKKHARALAWSPGPGDPGSAGQARPSGRAGGGCPGLARSFDCATWPPPIEEDADRRSGDGGG